MADEINVMTLKLGNNPCVSNVTARILESGEGRKETERRTIEGPKRGYDPGFAG